MAGEIPTPEELTQAQTDELHQRLRSDREEIEAQLEASRDGARPVGLDEPIGRLTRMDAMQQQKMTQANRRSLEARLQQVTGALTALGEGEYGFCVRCEEPVGYPRLKARPETRLCLLCQEEIESRGGH